MADEDSCGGATCSKETQTENLYCDSTKLKHIKDPIHGSIELHPLLYAIINTPEFHRLKFIRQLGGGFYVYPGATHTRFEHSIGVCYLAGQFARMLKEKQPELGITWTDVLTVEVAGLCHDLGHGPFSHVFDRQVLNSTLDDGKEWKHEELSQKIVDRIFDKLEDTYDVDPKVVATMIHYKPKEISKDRHFLYQIVANKTNGIDVDKWDYFIRDCHYLGLQHEFDYRRLMQLSRVIEVNVKVEKEEKKEGAKEGAIEGAKEGEKDGAKDEREGEKEGTEEGAQEEEWELRKIICYHEKEADNILGMFRTRCSLFKKAYNHKTVVAVEYMISSALLKVKGEHFLRVDAKNTKMSLEDIVKQLNDGKLKDEEKLAGFLALTDDIVSIIKAQDLQGFAEAQQLFDQIAERKIPRRKAQDLQGFAEAQQLFDQIAERKIPRRKVIVPFPHEGAKPSETEEIEDTLKPLKKEMEDEVKELKKKEKETHGFIYFAEFSYQSEKKGFDPYKDVYFYSKDSFNEAKPLPEEKKSKVFVPEQWGERAVWIYTSEKFPKEKTDEFERKIKELIREIVPVDDKH